MDILWWMIKAIVWVFCGFGMIYNPFHKVSEDYPENLGMAYLHFPIGKTEKEFKKLFQKSLGKNGENICINYGGYDVNEMFKDDWNLPHFHTDMDEMYSRLMGGKGCVVCVKDYTILCEEIISRIHNSNEFRTVFNDKVRETKMKSAEHEVAKDLFINQIKGTDCPRCNRHLTNFSRHVYLSGASICCIGCGYLLDTGNRESIEALIKKQMKGSPDCEFEKVG